MSYAAAFPGSGPHCAVEERPPDHKLVAGELDFETTKKDSDKPAKDDGGKVLHAFAPS